MTSTRRWLAAGAVGILGVLAGGSHAAAQTADLTTLSLQDLLNVEITSASRKEQPLSRTAAAVYVITQEDIRRSGAKTIPDVLRMAPGFTVGQIDSTNWGVSARGFNGLYANKLLVLVDGRSVYSMMFGGVHWDMLNMPLGDIDRIEVIRGPGGTLWGVNAVNGVINIITKPADATQGGFVSAGLGTFQRTATEFRYGGKAGERGHYRVFGRYGNRATGDPTLGFDDPDDASTRVGGARYDWRGETDTLAIHGSVQEAQNRHVYTRFRPVAPWPTETAVGAVAFTEGNVMLAWTRSTSSRSETAFQTYYEGFDRRTEGVSARWHVVDVDARHRRAIGRRHEVVAGLAYRFAAVDVVNTSQISFLPPTERLHNWTGFVQDEIELTSALRLSPGAKIERNFPSGFEVQPSVRLTWTATRSQSLWAAATRAVRTASKIDRDLRIPVSVTPTPSGLLVATEIRGTADYRSEDMTAVEGGYRWQRGRVSIDATAFKNAYNNLRAIQPGEATLGSIAGRPAMILPLLFRNGRGATAVGAELAMTWQPLAFWRVSGSQAWLQVDAEAPATVGAAFTDRGTPEQQFHVRTYLDLPGHIEASALFFAASSVPGIQVEAYRKLDARLAWHPVPRIELAASVQNLLHDGQREFRDAAGPVTIPVRTAVFGEVAWRF